MYNTLKNKIKFKQQQTTIRLTDYSFGYSLKFSILLKLGLLGEQTVLAGERAIIIYHAIIFCTCFMIPLAADRMEQPLFCAFGIVSVPICMVADGAWLLLLLGIWLLLWFRHWLLPFFFALPLNVGEMFITCEVHGQRFNLFRMVVGLSRTGTWIKSLNETVASCTTCTTAVSTSTSCARGGTASWGTASGH